jgi:4'-phosphopantetheinyl transferase
MQNTIDLWRACVSEVSPQLPRLAGWLSADESARAGRYRFDDDRRRFVVSRGVLRFLLGRYLGCHPAAIEFAYDAFGKPALANRMARAIQFNVSHSGEIVVYAFGAGIRFGIDVEKVRPIDDIHAVAERFFSEIERRHLRQASAEVLCTSFLTCWVRKEAYVKALGSGLSTPLDRFSVALLPGEAAEILAIDGSREKASRWRLQHLEPAAGYIGAIAIDGRDAAISDWSCVSPELLETG